MIDNTIFNDKKIYYHTFGCKLNFAEISALGRQLTQQGFTKVNTNTDADVCVINTCSVTDTADHKCRQAIKRIARENPTAKIVVTGCYAQLKPKEIADIEGVDLVLGANEKFQLLDYLNQTDDSAETLIFRKEVDDITRFSPSCSQEGRTRFFLKVQDGCNYACTYCTIPLARGKSRSGTIAETVAEAKKAIIDDGAKEIVLTGVNTGDFGRTNGENFLQLLQEIDRIDEDFRLRISSVEPNLLSEKIIDFVGESRHIMPHFHIPLQSGADEVLRIMRRRYTTSLFAKRVSYIRQTLPNAFIGVDVIVGVSGESETLFEKSYQFISQLDISQLHVFTYSERANTPMAEMKENVPIKQRKARSEKLHQLSEEKLQAFYQKQIGKKSRVLWERNKKGDMMAGFTENYVRMERPYDASKVNTIEEVVVRISPMMAEKIN